MKPPYTVSEDKKKQFAGIYILEYMINKPHHFPVLLSGNDQDLESVLEWLLIRDYIEIQDSECYIPTEKGRSALTKFLARYTEFLNLFDVYSAVDLAVGEFAFSSYFDFKDNAAWRKFLDDERWDDLRIAVAAYKKLDPIEIVFMSFIAEKRFGRDQIGWQFDLLLGSVWDEILEICNTAIHWNQLGYRNEDGAVPAEEVIEDIIIQGAELMIELHKKEADLAPKYLDNYDREPSLNNNGNGSMEKVTIEDYPVSHYNAYRDPLYVSPFWLGLWFL